jgi:chromosome segregation ATPase
MTEDSESVEDRLATLEAQFDELDVGDVEGRIATIEDEQAALRDDVGALVESLREKEEDTVHIESVKPLHQRLESLEEDISHLRESLETVVDDTE